MDSTPRVLQNKGIPIELGEETIELTLTCGSIGDLEDEFGSLEEWQSALEKKPASVARKTIAFATGRPENEVKEQMAAAPLVDYVTAISVAWAVANGLDPTSAGNLLAAAREASRAATAIELKQVLGAEDES